MILSREYLDAALQAISHLIDALSNFKDGTFDETSHKEFSLLREFYTQYTYIYTKNMEILDNALTPQIKLSLAPIQNKINNFILQVNTNPNNMRLPMYITSHEEENK
ncbi:BlyB family putative holin accessory protein (plasmid) [Borrelia miyamotoi]|uniref:Hemolysin accessory protein n=3 Tax=Borrelia miyamotoi TaxID=47466 RepID=W5SFQ1_9SPIR|nr:BlyB family putative holin accessory protein [Borrelia miyamotoi]AHH05725.1 Hemolysin accessory protein [Borrelia miyamotoi FR64b]ATQ15484.1 BlyB family putative holin accessory protein [Borrelia miyamotoi]ATQ17970.2 BlyB family putative holin accessory protein [Borrelia miyamotoi]ATQ21630.2 BlyB family putative holin accessory protein [Borrelia miyamotoi]QBK65319.1 biotin--acetyl-CoA-carboxylase ligase [Borrelia miyamotoi]